MTNVLASAISKSNIFPCICNIFLISKWKTFLLSIGFYFLFWKIERNAAKLLFYLLLILMIKNSRSSTNLILVIVTKSRTADSCKDIPDAASPCFHSEVFRQIILGIGSNRTCALYNCKYVVFLIDGFKNFLWLNLQIFTGNFNVALT